MKRPPLKIYVALGALLGLGALVAANPGAVSTILAKLRENAPASKAKNAKAVKPVAAPAVSVVRIGTADFTETVLVSGSVVAREEVLVAPEVEGLRVAEIHAEEGDRVTKGQVLARLVSESLDAQIAQNTAALSRTDAAIAQARSSIAQSEARLVEAKNALDRARPLKQSGFLAESVLDQRQAAATAADAALAAARDGLKLAEAEKRQVEAQRREIEWRRGNTQIKSTVDGIISRRTARVGALATAAAEPLFRIITNGEVELEAEVPETQLGKIRMEQIARVSIAGGQEVTGRLRLVSPEVDKATRLGKVRISLGTDPAIRVGSFGRGVIETARSRGLAVPVTALVHRAEGPTVQLVVETKVEARAVRIGLSSDGLVEIRSGVAAGDLVVARSGSFLRDGDVVRPVIVEQSKVSEIN